MTRFRINIFEQISLFFDEKNELQKEMNVYGVSLYMYFLYLANKSGWKEWVGFSPEKAKKFSCIGSKTTFYRTLHSLEHTGFIRYTPGNINNKQPQVHIVKLKKNGLINEPPAEKNKYGNELLKPFNEPVKFKNEPVIDDERFKNGLIPNNNNNNNNLSLIKEREGESFLKKIEKENEIILPWSGDNFFDAWTKYVEMSDKVLRRRKKPFYDKNALEAKLKLLVEVSGNSEKRAVRILYRLVSMNYLDIEDKE